MKTLLTLAVFVFLFQQAAMAQNESPPKNTNPNQQAEASIEPVQAAIPIGDFTDGGGGYSDHFYYGNPGGMFLEKDWVEGTAFLIDGNEMQGSFRYNLYYQKMEAALDGDTFAIAKPFELDLLKLGDREFKYISYIRGDYEVANSWFELLEEGNCNLLVRRYIKYQVTDGDDNPANDKLYRVKEYYVLREGMEMERLLLSKDNVKKALADHESEICDYMKAEKLKIKDEADLIKLFAYYNSLD